MQQNKKDGGNGIIILQGSHIIWESVIISVVGRLWEVRDVFCRS